METIGITGGCGLVGSNLISRLKKLGYKIKVLDNLSFGKYETIKDLDINFIEGDIRDDKKVLEFLDGIDVLVHLAASGSVVDSVRNPLENFSVNVQGTFNLINHVRNYKIRKIIFSSTGGALFGNTTPPVNEQSLPRPISPYGASKLACEAYLSAFANSYNQNTTIFRFANVIGPNCEHKKGIITTCFKALLNNEPITIYGDGKSTRDYIDVRDLAWVISESICKNFGHLDLYHLASGFETSVFELIKSIEEVTGKNFSEIIYEKKRIGEVERNFASYELARDKFNFTPKYSIKDSIKTSWDSFKYAR